MLMQEILWKVFKPYEVKLTVAEVKGFFKAHEDMMKSAWAGVITEVEREAIAVAKEAKDIVYSVRIEQMKPEHVALIIIGNILDWKIGSGYYHRYRGVLNESGNQMLLTLNKVNSIMINRGYATPDEISKLSKEVSDRIKNAG